MTDVLYIWEQFFGLFSGFWSLLLTFCSGILIAIIILKVVVDVIMYIFDRKEE